MWKRLFGLLLGDRLAVTQGELTVPGPHAPIILRRDAHGVAYVEASSDDDAFFGMGFAVGQDRAFHVELYLRVARGRLAELVGAEMLDADRLSRRIGFERIARAQLAVMDEANRKQLEAYARGVNAGVRFGAKKRSHEHAILRAEPSVFEPWDVLAVLQFFAFALSSNWDAELARLRILSADGPEALQALEAADPTWLAADGNASRLTVDVDALQAAERLAASAAELGRAGGLGGASNNWVLAPSRTATGRPLLACDPHLSPTLPSPWYLVHVRAPDWAISGACLVTQPMLSFGHNEHVAWGVTAGHVDNTDLFVEKVGKDGRSVLEGNAYVPCDVREETIGVKGRAPVVERVLVTRRGPIVSPPMGGDDVALSMRGTWMAARPIRYDLFRARDVGEARRTYECYPGISESRLFADTGGHISWQIVGDAPVRRKGNGLVPMPGWDPGAGWEDEPRPFDALPGIVDPDVGFLASANNRPPIDTGVFLGADWLDGHRYARIVEELAKRRDWGVPGAMKLQMDRTTVVWKDLRTPLVLALRKHPNPETETARELLEGWDGVVSPESEGAAVFELLFAEMMQRAAKAKAPRSFKAAIGEGTNAILPHGIMGLRRIDHLARLLRAQPGGWFAKGWPAEIAAALASVVPTLQKAGGEGMGAWAWGRVRPLVLVHAPGTKAPLDRIFNRGPFAFGGDATTIPQASVDFLDPLGNAIGVPNLRMVVDVGNWEASRYVLAGGQSGNPMSPHYDDLLPLWEKGEGIPIAWAPESVASAAAATLHLVPSRLRDPVP
jgi:penicillin amidase